MVFSKKKNYAKKREMAESFHDFKQHSACATVSKEGRAEVGVQQAWKWIKDAAALFHGLPSSISSLGALIESLREVVRTGAWDKIRSDDKLRFSILFWLSRIALKARDNLGSQALPIVNFFKFDGLGNLSDNYWERKPITPKPEKGPGFYPSVIEGIALAIYRVIKTQCSGPAINMNTIRPI